MEAEARAEAGNQLKEFPTALTEEESISHTLFRKHVTQASYMPHKPSVTRLKFASATALHKSKQHLFSVTYPSISSQCWQQCTRRSF